MHVILLIPTLLVLTFFGVVLCAIWCLLCFRMGHWLARSATSQQPERDRPEGATPRQGMAAPTSPYPPRPRDDGGRGRSGNRQSSGIALILALLVVCLVFFGFQRREKNPFNAVGAADPVVTVPNGPDRLLGSGFGETREDAELMAFEQAYVSLDSYLRDDLRVHWVPSRSHVRAHMVKELKYEGTRVQPDLGRVHEVNLRLEVTPQDRKDFVRRDRLLLLAKLLGVTLALLVTVAGYVRLDELSKGYYNAWLRLGAISVATVAGAGLWFFTWG